jgi:hypothetical protein
MTAVLTAGSSGDAGGSDDRDDDRAAKPWRARGRVFRSARGCAPPTSADLEAQWALATRGAPGRPAPRAPAPRLSPPAPTGSATAAPAPTGAATAAPAIGAATSGAATSRAPGALDLKNTAGPPLVDPGGAQVH